MNRKILSAVLVVSAAAALGYAVIVDFLGLVGPWAIPVITALVVASLVTRRDPSGAIGWLMMAFAWTTSVSVGIGTLALTQTTGALLGALGAISQAFNTAGTLVLPIILLRFPEGGLMSRRWRYVEWLTLAAAALGGTAALINGGWGGDPLQAIAEPPWRDQAGPVGDVLSQIFFMVLATSLVASGVSLGIRFKRSVGDERLRLKWVAVAAGFVVLAISTTFILSGLSSVEGGWEELLVAASFAAIPASIGFAVLRYRLYDIDVVISRSVVFAVLVGFVAVIYGAMVLGLGALIGGDSGGWTPILATAVVALAFEPVRHVAQRWANRIAYGHRATPYEVLADLTERLTGAGDGDDILERLASLVVDGTGADQAIVWLGPVGEMRPVASTADQLPEAGVDLAAPTVFPVTADGALVGALEVIKPKGTSLSTQERALMADLVGSAGAVFANRRLNESLTLKVREIEMSRSRLVEAEDHERRRLEHELNESAQQAILALKVNVGIARRKAADKASEALVGLLGTLEDETQSALEEVRNLAKGIYPPVLESDGLGAAVSALAAGSPIEVQVIRDGVGRYSREIEAAVYFNISEALTNAVKHAEPPIRVELSQENGLLRFTVADSGPGFDLATVVRGSGLENLQDRIDAVGGRMSITSTPGSGTRVLGEIPVGARSVAG